MDPSVPRVLEALRVLHGSNTKEPDRKIAQDYLRALENSLGVATALDLAVGLLSAVSTPTGQRIDEPGVHFGFHVIDMRVLEADCWDGAAPHEKARLRQMALEFFRVVSQQQPGRLPSFVHQKTAGLVSSIAVRQWPQAWPSFVEEMLSLAVECGASGDALLCIVWRTLSDDVFEFGNRISSARRQNLSKALSVALDKILAHVRRCVEAFLQAENRARLLIAIGALESLLSWCDITKAFEAGLPTACVTLLKHPVAHDAALEALSVFVARRVPPPASPASLATCRAVAEVRTVLFPGVLECAMSPMFLPVISQSFLPVDTNIFPVHTTLASTQANVEEGHDFRVRFVSMLASLGASHFHVCFLPGLLTPREASDQHRAIALAYLELMSCAVAHPSKAIQEAALSFFISILKRPSQSPKASRKAGDPAPHGSLEAAGQTVGGKALYTRMTSRFSDAAMLALVDHPTQVIWRGFKEIDFDGDEEDWKDVSALNRSKVISSLGQASAACPVSIVPVAFARLSHLVENVQKAIAHGFLVMPDDAVEDASLPGVSTPFAVSCATGILAGSWNFAPFSKNDGRLVLACLEGLVSATDAVVAGAYHVNMFEGDPAGAQYLEQLALLFDKLSSVQEAQFNVLKVTTFKMFIPVFLRDQVRLQRALEALVRYASGPATSGPLRKRASNALATVCRRVGKSSSGALDSVRLPLCQFVAPALVAPDRLSHEKSKLLDAACTCILTLSTVEERTKWMETLLGPLLEHVDIEKPWCAKALQSSANLFQFSSSEDPIVLNKFAESLYLLQTSTHHVVRGASHSSTSIDLPNPLSQTIAPKVLNLAARLVVALHGLFNPSKFGAHGDARMRSALLPTSQEVVAVLNLEGGESNFLTGIQAPPVLTRGVVLDNRAGRRADDILSRHGIPCPQPEMGNTREALRLMRRGGYELLRNTILSGVTLSPPHVKLAMDAISSDHEYLEPLHLSYLMNHILKVLLSFQVVAANPNVLQVVEESCVPKLLNVAREHIESAGANSVVVGADPTLDFVREGSRVRLCSDGADVLSAVFPRVSQKPGEQAVVTSLPVPLVGTGALSTALWNLFRCLCGPDVALLCGGGASRSVCTLLSRVVQSAPDGSGVVFGALATQCFESAVACESRGEGHDGAISAIVDVLARFPQEACEELAAWVRLNAGNCETRLSSIFSQVVKSLSIMPPADCLVVKKKSRRTVRLAVKTLGDALGLRQTKKTLVRSLNMPMPSMSSKPERRLRTADTDDLILSEQDLDNLFQQQS